MSRPRCVLSRKFGALRSVARLLLRVLTTRPSRHPNVSSANGAICLDVLKDQWSPALTLKTALLSVQSLLASPEPKDPQDAVVARQYMSEHEVFVRTAKQWTQQYANECVLARDAPSRLTILHLTVLPPLHPPGPAVARVRSSRGWRRWDSTRRPSGELSPRPAGTSPQH